MFQHEITDDLLSLETRLRQQHQSSPNSAGKGGHQRVTSGTVEMQSSVQTQRPSAASALSGWKESWFTKNRFGTRKRHSCSDLLSAVRHMMHTGFLLKMSAPFLI